jgi:hypothetical protein
MTGAIDDPCNLAVAFVHGCITPLDARGGHPELRDTVGELRDWYDSPATASGR